MATGAAGRAGAGGDPQLERLTWMQFTPGPGPGQAHPSVRRAIPGGGPRDHCSSVGRGSSGRVPRFLDGGADHSPAVALDLPSVVDAEKKGSTRMIAPCNVTAIIEKNTVLLLILLLIAPEEIAGDATGRRLSVRHLETRI